MLRELAVAFVLGCPAAAEAYSQCTTTPLAGPGAVVSEEGSNPVSWGNYVYAGFAYKNQIGIAVSSDAGRSMDSPVTIYNGSGVAAQLRLSVSYQHVYALWRQKNTGYSLMFAASHDHGKSGSWDPAIDFGAHNPSLPQIASDGANVHIAYLQTDGTVAVLNSADAGRNFSAPVRIAAGWGEIVVTSLGRNVYVSWNTKVGDRFDVSLAVSHDGGGTFSVQNLSAPRPSDSNEPILALDAKSGRLSLVWREDTPQQGIYLQSLDNGVTWSKPLVIDSSTRQYMVADDGSYIYISYLKKFLVDGVPDWQIYLTRSIDGGKTFPPAKNLSGPTGISALVNDNERPIPWVSDKGQFRLTGVEADGVHIWNGSNGHILAPVYVGPGELASPSSNTATWEGPDGVVSFAVCH